jgi:large subunit ribosomal protein L15
MQLHEIKPYNKLKKKKRVGRGGKKGTYSGKGMKGQKSRAGAKIRPEIRDMIKKIPKLRGYRFKKKTNKKPLYKSSLKKKIKSQKSIKIQAKLRYPKKNSVQRKKLKSKK